MTGLFATDVQRACAADLRRLLKRLEGGEGEDRALGADIVNALDAPPMIGDPTGCIDCALHLADALKQDGVDVLASAVVDLRQRVLSGWKRGGEITTADAARAISAIVLRVYIAKLEKAPA